MTARVDEVPALRELQQHPNWIVRNAAKIPFNPRSGAGAKAGQPATWSSYEQAQAALRRHPEKYAGLGYEFARECGITGIDLDHCVDEDGNIDAWAQAIIDSLASYAEYSANDGIHIFVRGNLPAGCRHKIALVGERHPEAAIELYDDKRYFAMTFNQVSGTPDTIEPRQAALDALLARYSQPAEPMQASPRAKQAPDLSDQELIDKAMSANNGAKFARLWRGDIAEYGNDESRADLALCTLLAFWTGKDARRIDSLFRQSGLMRAKWDRPTSGSTYGAITIERACAGVRETYTPGMQSEQVKRSLESLLRRVDTVKPEQKKLGKSAADLMRMELPPVRWIVPDILPEGLTVLAGKPKLGKSWLALHLALAVAYGGIALSAKQCEPGNVLYLALEDNIRRLQSRLRKLMVGDAIPDALAFDTECPRLEDGGYALIEEWIISQKNPRLIIIDTWQKISPRPAKQKNEYELASDALGLLKRLADTYSVAIVVVHHMRKSASETGDFLDEVNGSIGIPGTADVVLGLKRARGQIDAELCITGRDIEDDSTLALTFDKERALWCLQGKANEVARSKEQQAILDLLAEYPGGLTVKEINEALQKKYDTTRNIVASMLKAQLISQPYPRGKYYSLHHTPQACGERERERIVPSVPSVPSDDSVPSVHSGSHEKPDTSAMPSLSNAMAQKPHSGSIDGPEKPVDGGKRYERYERYDDTQETPYCQNAWGEKRRRIVL